MRKSLFYFTIAITLILVLGATLKLSSADDPAPYELAQTEYSTSTSIGTIDIPIGSLVGGAPANYIVLTEQTVMETTMGTRVLNAGTKIKCGEPGYPPCNPY